MTDRPYKWICVACKGDNVETDGWLKWDIGQQRWQVVDDTGDRTWCATCQDHTELDTVELTSLEDCATYAIAQDERKEA